MYWDIIDIQYGMSLGFMAKWFELQMSWNDCHNNFIQYPSLHIDTKLKEKKIPMWWDVVIDYQQLSYITYKLL